MILGSVETCPTALFPHFDAWDLSFVAREMPTWVEMTDLNGEVYGVFFISLSADRWRQIAL